MIIKNADQRGYLSSESLDKTISDILSYKRAGLKKTYSLIIQTPNGPLHEAVEIDEDEFCPYSEDLTEDWEMDEHEVHSIVYEEAKKEILARSGGLDEDALQIPENYDPRYVEIEQISNLQEAEEWKLWEEREELLISFGPMDDEKRERYGKIEEKFKRLTGKTFQEAMDEEDRRLAKIRK